jgi:hypothetical protein
MLAFGVVVLTIERMDVRTARILVTLRLAVFTDSGATAIFSERR